MAAECDFVTGRSVAAGGAGDSSVLTAFGVHEGCSPRPSTCWDAAGAAGRRIGIAGVGKVGKHLLEPRPRRRRRGRRHRRRPGGDGVGARATTPTSRSSPMPTTLVRAELDVYAPCALGGALDDEVAEVLRAAIVCGGANNQLAHDRIDNRLAERGIVYCPDYLVNAGGVIQVADERHGFSFERAKAKTAGIRDRHPRPCCAPPRPRASPRARPPTAWPNGGWRPSPGRRRPRIPGTERAPLDPRRSPGTTAPFAEGALERRVPQTRGRCGRLDARRCRGTRPGGRPRPAGGASRRAGRRPGAGGGRRSTGRSRARRDRCPRP